MDYEKYIVSQKITIEQPEDCCGRAGETHQYIDIETQDGGGGAYIVIKTDRWAIGIEDIDSFVKIMKKMIASIKEEDVSL